MRIFWPQHYTISVTTFMRFKKSLRSNHENSSPSYTHAEILVAKQPTYLVYISARKITIRSKMIVIRHHLITSNFVGWHACWASLTVTIDIHEISILVLGDGEGAEREREIFQYYLHWHLLLVS